MMLMMVKVNIKIKVQVLSLDLKLILTTLQLYPADHWKWPHSCIFDLSIFAGSLGHTVRLHFLSATHLLLGGQRHL